MLQSQDKARSYESWVWCQKGRELQKIFPFPGIKTSSLLLWNQRTVTNLSNSGPCQWPGMGSSCCLWWVWPLGVPRLILGRLMTERGRGDQRDQCKAEIYCKKKLHQATAKEWGYLTLIFCPILQGRWSLSPPPPTVTTQLMVRLVCREWDVIRKFLREEQGAKGSLSGSVLATQKQRSNLRLLVQLSLVMKRLLPFTS